MTDFIIKYRVIVIVLCVLLLIYFPLEAYKGMACISLGNTGQGVGTILTAVVVDLCVPIYVLFVFRKIRRKGAGVN